MKLGGKQLTAVLAIAGATILLQAAAVAVLTAPSHSAAPRHAAVTAPACGNAHLGLPGGALVWASSQGDGFAGGMGYLLEITNVGRHACSLRGVPGAAVQDYNGHLIGGKIPASGAGPLVILEPGATAHFQLAMHEPLIVCAHPVDGDLLIYLPGQQQAQSHFLGAGACPGLRGGGTLSLEAIQPGLGVPYYSF